MNPGGQPIDDERWSELWRESAPPPPDPKAVIRDLSARSNKLHRAVRNRNLREYAAGVVMLAWFGYDVLFNPARFVIAVAGIAVTLGVLGYMWLQHRDHRPPDPSLDAESFRRDLLARYDAQIRLLSRVKYWYVGPLYAWMVFSALADPRRPSGPATWIVLAIITALSAFVVWLNESYAVRKLRAERTRVESGIS